MRLERRIVSFDCRMDDADEGVFSGYGSVFGELDSYADEVVAGAFAKSLKQHVREGTWPEMLFSHMVTEPIGEWLDIHEDDRGLFAKGRLWIGQDGRPPDAYAVKSYRAMQRKRGKFGLSIGFQTRKSDDKVPGRRRLTEVALWEISPVAFPANGKSRVSAVKSDGTLPTAREFERFLRYECGFSEAQAKGFLSKGYQQVLREAGELDDDDDGTNHEGIITTRREAGPSEEACGELVALIQRGAAIFTGGQR